MRPLVIFIFSSLVCHSLVSIAAPTGTEFEKDYQRVYPSESTEETRQSADDWQQTFSVSDPGPMKPMKRRLLPRYQEMVNQYAFTLFTQLETETQLGFGMNYGWRNDRGENWQADFLFDSDFRFRLGIANYHRSEVGRSLIGMWKWGVSHRFIANEQLASFLNIENYFLRLGAGLEQVFSSSGTRLEIETYTSFKFKDSGFYVFLTYLF